MVSEFLLDLDLALELGLVKSFFILFADFGKLELFAFNKLRMGETLLVARVTCFYKAVHVKLAHERRKVIVFEVLRQNLLCELVCLIYHETVPVVVPIYRGVIRGILII
jgi:hypothetical protein